MKISVINSMCADCKSDVEMSNHYSNEENTGVRKIQECSGQAFNFAWEVQRKLHKEVNI